MTNWQTILADSITTPADLPRDLQPELTNLTQVTNRYPMRVNSYYLGLIRSSHDPIWLQAVPQMLETQDKVCDEDCLAEERLSPVSGIVHKYKDRVLFLAARQCAMYCRFCTRKRKVGTPGMIVDDQTILAGVEYIRSHPEVRDVLISGGDPLLLDDERLEWLLAMLREIPTVEIIRLGTRVPCTLPMRVTPKLCTMLKKYHPLYINTHFNHPWEITAESSAACAMLADAGIPLGCQTVLLRGVNDSLQTIHDLMRGLLKIRVKPYYLFQGDLSRGTNHFRTSIECGQEIMRGLLGTISGMGIPTYAVDGPGGVGKIPLTPNYIKSLSDQLVFKNYEGKTCFYENGG